MAAMTAAGGSLLAFAMLAPASDHAAAIAWLDKWQTLIAGVLGIGAGASALLAAKLQIQEQRRDKEREELATTEHKVRLLAANAQFHGAQLTTAIYVLSTTPSLPAERLDDAIRMARRMIASADAIRALVEDIVISGAALIRAALLLQIASNEVMSLLHDLQSRQPKEARDVEEEFRHIAVQTAKLLIALAHNIANLVSLHRQRPGVPITFGGPMGDADIDPTTLPELIRKQFEDREIDIA